MSEIQTRSSKQSFLVPGTALEKSLKTIAVICSKSLALVAGFLYVRDIQDHIDVQENRVERSAAV